FIPWIFGSIVGAVAGILIAPIIFLDINLMGSILIKAFSGAVLGGLDSIIGSYLGAILFGIIENISGVYISGSLKEAIAYLIVIIVLTIKPDGLFGRTEKRKV
ncbi:branched-chain amino acid ABC transporter permease, partial [Neobacillus niacini]